MFTRWYSHEIPLNHHEILLNHHFPMLFLWFYYVLLWFLDIAGLRPAGQDVQQQTGVPRTASGGCEEEPRGAWVVLVGGAPG